jgi:hypothetical protein
MKRRGKIMRRQARFCQSSKRQYRVMSGGGRSPVRKRPGTDYGDRHRLRSELPPHRCRGHNSARLGPTRLGLPAVALAAGRLMKLAQEQLMHAVGLAINDHIPLGLTRAGF